MRDRAPFQPDDLEALDGLLAQATVVVPMLDIHEGKFGPHAIGLRHDVDNAIEPAVEFAFWEAERGYRATYYVLHTAPYWQDKDLLRASLEMIASLGHEIGIHNNALAEAHRTGEDPRRILVKAICELHELGHKIRGTVAHGDPDCYDRAGRIRFVNDQLFTECQREYDVPVKPLSLSKFGLDYDANWLPRGGYLSDSGGRWSQPFQKIADGFPYPGQLHMLVHPDWWQEAFQMVTA